MTEGPVEEWGYAPFNWKRLAEEAISAQLKDPGSAKFSFENIPRMTEEKIENTTRFYEDVVVRVNSKNSFGAYTGLQNWHVAYKNHQVEFAKPQ